MIAQALLARQAQFDTYEAWVLMGIGFFLLLSAYFINKFRKKFVAVNNL